MRINFSCCQTLSKINFVGIYGTPTEGGLILPGIAIEVFESRIVMGPRCSWCCWQLVMGPTCDYMWVGSNQMVGVSLGFHLSKPWLILPKISLSLFFLSPPIPFLFLSHIWIRIVIMFTTTYALIENVTPFVQVKVLMKGVKIRKEKGGRILVYD